MVLLSVRDGRVGRVRWHRLRGLGHGVGVVIIYYPSRVFVTVILVIEIGLTILKVKQVLPRLTLETSISIDTDEAGTAGMDNWCCSFGVVEVTDFVNEPVVEPAWNAWRKSVISEWLQLKNKIKNLYLPSHHHYSTCAFSWHRWLNPWNGSAESKGWESLLSSSTLSRRSQTQSWYCCGQLLPQLSFCPDNSKV